MSSSTSSSRKVFGRIFLAIVLGMAVAMAIIRLITFLNDISGDTILGRVLEARAALPRIVAEDKPLVMVFGSSMTQAGFSARQFDRELSQRGIDIKSFNFGFGGLNPYFQDFLSRRIREAFEQEERRLELALIEFVPFQLTKARWEGAQPVIDSFVGMLASPREMWQITLEDPARGALMFNIRYLRDDISAEMTTWHLGRPLQPERPRSNVPADEEASERLSELGDQLNQVFEVDYPDYGGEQWHYPWQGAGTIPEERKPSTLEIFEQYYEALRTPRRMENDKLNRIQCCDIEELHFEQELIDGFVRMVENFQRVSNHVEVILLPRNTDWIHYSPEARARLDAVLETIRRETGVTIRDYQELPAFDAELFSDTTHLSRYAGDVAFTSLLVDEYAPLLARSLGVTAPAGGELETGDESDSPEGEQ